MNPALDCPICGHRHRLRSRSNGETTFHCESCSTLLRVPEEARPAGPSGAPPPSGGRLVWPLRAFVWAAALPVGLVTTVVVLRTLGRLDTGDVVDLFLGTGPGRFAWVAVLVPLWAALSAALAHLSIETLSRRVRPRPGRAELTGRRVGPPRSPAQRRGSQRTRP